MGVGGDWPPRQISLPLSDVRSVAVQHVSAWKTTLVVVGGVIGVVVVATIIECSNPENAIVC